MTVSAENRWLVIPRPNPNAPVRLFCFPYAGAGSVIYRNWVEVLPEFIELVAIELPGRGKRLLETPYRELDRLIPDLAAALKSHLNRPYAIFGHSMGALIGFELIRYFRRHGLPLPLQLFVSGRNAPTIPDEADPPLHTLPDAEFKAKLKELDGTPAEVLEHQELMEILLPILRADFGMCENYVYRPEPPLDVPITAFGGLKDVSVRPEQVEAWKEQTRSKFTARFFPGGHFFLNDFRMEIIEILTRELEIRVRARTLKQE
ncbi:MAG: thioesterase [Calditrichaeota bacterium]|nr:thioesterase [Calditrichota bacterium]